MKRYTLRFAISTLVSGLILAVAASIAAVLYFGTRKALYVTTYEMMGQISHSMSDKLTQRLERVERLNILVSDLIHGGQIDPRKEEAFTDSLMDILAANPAITLIDCGLPSGHKYQALRMPDGTISRRLVHRGPRNVVSIWHDQNPAYREIHKDRVESLETGYDPRVRPWWKACMQEGGMVWTDIYPSRGGLNYSNVNPVYDEGGNLVCIVAIDMRVEDISTFLKGLQVGRTGKAFIIDKENRLVAMSMGPGQGMDEIVKKTGTGEAAQFSLKSMDEISDGNIRHAVRRYLKHPQMEGRGYLRFRDPEGRRILASFEPEPRYKFTFGVVVPEDDILGPIKQSMNITLGLTGLFLVLSLAAAYRISRSISRPMTTLAGEVDRIRLLDFSDGPAIRTSITEVLSIDRSIQNMRKGLRSFKKYVPSDVVTRLIHLQKEAVIEGEKRELTYFFSDIANFTNISEELPPEVLVAKLGTYFETVTRILMEGSGTVDKFIGDCVMAFWGAPNPTPSHAELACRSALRAQEAIHRLNQKWAAEGGQPFHTRIGIHTGEAIVGNIGYEGRMNYTVIGDSVNLASRLEGLNKHYGTRILVTEATLQAAGGTLLARIVDLVAVKGKDRPVAIHELLGLRAEASPEELEAVDTSNRAFDHYLHRRWAEAIALLQDRSDVASLALMDRCRRYQADPPPTEWDGVNRYHEK